MAGKLISELNEAGFLQTGDFIPIARGASTLKLPGFNLISRDSSGKFNFGALISTGLGASTGDCNIEVGGLRGASGNAYIDLHSVAGTDYEARWFRGPGINGDVSLQNKGTGNFNITQEGAGPICLNTSNTERMRITSTGFIGIGQTSPESALHITGNQGVASDLILEAVQTTNTTDTTGPAFVFRSKGGQLYTKTNDVVSQISSRGYSTVTGQVGYQSVGEIQTVATGNFNANSTRSADMTFSTSHTGSLTEKLRIKSDGKVGIGISTPTATLEIQPGHLKLGRINTSSEGGQLDFCRAGDNTSVWTIDQEGTGTTSSGNLRFFNTQTGVVRMCLAPDGTVGIGNTSPEANLHVSGAGTLLKISGSGQPSHGMVIKTADASGSTVRSAFWNHENENNISVSSMQSFVHADGGSDLYFQTSSPGSRTADRRTERMRFNKSGNLKLNVNAAGIGRDSDENYRLAINGKTYSTGYVTETGGYAFGTSIYTGMFAGSATGDLVFMSNDTPALYINQSKLIINRNVEITINGQLSVNKEFQILNTPDANQIRLVQGSYGVIQRNDGTNFYLVPTFSGAPLGGTSNLRPFSFNLSSGLVTIGNGLSVIGSVSATGSVTANSFVGNGSGLTNLTLANIVGLQQELDNRFGNIVTGVGNSTTNLTNLLNNKIEKPSSPQNGQLLSYNGSWVASTLSLSGDITSSGVSTSYNNVVPANKGGAGSINGLLKANGQGVVSQASSGVDYATPANLVTVQNNVNMLVPAGAVMAFYRSTPPTGWLECNGQSTAAYPNLVAIGVTVAPDLRGEFVRGWDNGKGTDPGRAIGTSQQDEFKSHSHTYTFRGYTAVQSGNATACWASESTQSSGSTGGTETRPKNIALMYCIKT